MSQYAFIAQEGSFTSTTALNEGQLLFIQYNGSGTAHAFTVRCSYLNIYNTVNWLDCEWQAPSAMRYNLLGSLPNCVLKLSDFWIRAVVFKITTSAKGLLLKIYTTNISLLIVRYFIVITYNYKCYSEIQVFFIKLKFVDNLTLTFIVCFTYLYILLFTSHFLCYDSKPSIYYLYVYVYKSNTIDSLIAVSPKPANGLRKTWYTASS